MVGRAGAAGPGRDARTLRRRQESPLTRGSPAATAAPGSRVCRQRLCNARRRCAADMPPPCRYPRNAHTVMHFPIAMRARAGRNARVRVWRERGCHARRPALVVHVHVRVRGRRGGAGRVRVDGPHGCGPPVRLAPPRLCMRRPYGYAFRHRRRRRRRRRAPDTARARGASQVPRPECLLHDGRPQLHDAEPVLCAAGASALRWRAVRGMGGGGGMAMRIPHAPPIGLMHIRMRAAAGDVLDGWRCAAACGDWRRAGGCTCVQFCHSACAVLLCAVAAVVS